LHLDVPSLRRPGLRASYPKAEVSWTHFVASRSISAVALICLPCSGNLGRATAIKRRWTAQASDLPDLGFEVTERAVNEGKVREMLTRAQRFVRRGHYGVSVW